MRFALFLFVLLLICSCERRESAVRQRVVGTWALTNGHGTITIAPNGSLHSHFTGSTQAWTYEGTWHIKGEDQIILTTTSSNSVPCHDTASGRIIRADGRELIYEMSGQTISLSRK
jgi:hypothetical protein